MIVIFHIIEYLIMIFHDIPIVPIRLPLSTRQAHLDIPAVGSLQCQCLRIWTPQPGNQLGCTLKYHGGIPQVYESPHEPPFNALIMGNKSTLINLWIPVVTHCPYPLGCTIGPYGPTRCFAIERLQRPKKLGPLLPKRKAGELGNATDVAWCWGNVVKRIRNHPQVYHKYGGYKPSNMGWLMLVLTTIYVPSCCLMLFAILVATGNGRSIVKEWATQPGATGILMMMLMLMLMLLLMMMRRRRRGKSNRRMRRKEEEEQENSMNTATVQAVNLMIPSQLSVYSLVWLQLEHAWGQTSSLWLYIHSNNATGTP